MKTKIILPFVVLVLSCFTLSAQMELGMAVTSSSAVNSTDPVVRIFDVRDADNPSSTDPPTLGNNWGWGLGNSRLITPPGTWTASELGQVFGIAINTNSSDHTIYAANTQIYPVAASFTPTGGFLQAPNPTVTGSSLIWALTPSAPWTADILVASTITEPLTNNGTNGIYNNGSGLGNICFDRNNNQIFATNMEDGRIYRIDITTGNILSRYDPFGLYSAPGSLPTEPTFVERGERLWGIAYGNNKVYFSRWVEDMGHIDASGADNSIFSVELDNNGEFAPTGSGGNTGFNYFDPNPNVEITNLPHLNLTVNFSNPVADIEISADGSTLLLAERTMNGTHYADFPTAILSWAHSARVLRYDWNGASWVPSSSASTPFEYKVGNACPSSVKSANSTGGCDFGHEQDLIWASGDALKFNTYPPYHGLTNDFVYGIAGIPITGNTEFDNTGTAPSTATNRSSVYLHIFGSVAPTTTIPYTEENIPFLPYIKTGPGDVDIYRNPCPPIDVPLAHSYNLNCAVACGGAMTAEDATGGTPPYTYQWNNGATTMDISDLCSTNPVTGLPGYTVTVTDANGCQGIATAMVANSPPIVINADIDNVRCYGESNGSISLSVSGGPELFPLSNPVYTWSPNIGSTANVTGLQAGTYSVTVTKGPLCSATATFEITGATSPLTASIESEGPVCYNSCHGAATVTVSGGVPGYTYSWSPSSGNEASVNGLCSGSHTVTVTDANGCSASLGVDIGQLTEIVLASSVMHPGCVGEPNGSISLTVTGGGSPYSYAWSNGSSLSTVSGLSAGIYSVTVVDANDCSVTASYTLHNFNAVASSVLAPICYGTNTGSSTVTVVGGTAPYTYLWSNGGTASVVTNLPAGPFSVTVTDANGCTDISTGGVVSAPELIVGIQAVSPVTCYGSCNGQATAVVTGGTPGYTYNWYNSASTSSTATDLCAGSFEVTVTDALGCKANASVGIETPSAMDVILSVSHVSCYEQNDGSITADVTGGTQPYTYAWSGGMTSQMIDGLHPTMYTLTVTDANGCSATAMAIINDAPVFEGELIMPDTLCVGSKDTVKATGTGYGRFIFEDGHTDIFSLSDGFIMEITASPGDVGTHLVCLVVYSAEPAEGVDVCTDTICREAVIIGCGCDSIAGNADLWSNSMGNMKYEFYNAGSIEASFINWYVDGQMMGQTTGHGGFSHQFTQGMHEICMEAAYILPGINGHNICCYDRVCDSIRIDLCEAWKAESRISTSADINNYHNVTFHFGGNMSPVPTIIWNFGDNTTEVSSGTDAVTHYYPTSGTYDVCAYVVWSNGEWTPEDLAVCCCVDTICFTVEVTPCNGDAYHLWVEVLNANTPTVELAPMPPIGADIVWYLDGSTEPLQTGDSRYHTFTQGITGYHEVCAEVSYTLSSDFPGESDFLCNLRICNRFSFGDMPKPYGMLRYFPNPTRNMITVEYMAGLNEVVSIAIMDPLGKVMKVKEVTSQTEGLDQAYITLDGLASGLYLMRVAVAKEVQTVKILKE